MIKQLLHPAFSVDDFEKSLNFYCNILGFEKLFTLNDQEGKPRTMYVKVAEGQYFELFQAHPDRDGIQPADKANTLSFSSPHVCLLTNDLDELYSRILHAGWVERYSEKESELWLRDPDRNLICVRGRK